MILNTSETSFQVTPETTDTNSLGETIAFATAHCALGQVLVARSIKGFCAILMGEVTNELEADLAGRFPRNKVIASEATVRTDLAKVMRFLDNPAEGLELPLETRGTPFQRLVWEKLRAIPMGKTITYADVARSLGPMTSPRAVARVCASNPIALAVPCHRVVRSDGGLGGYRCGVERKRALLDKESDFE